MTARLTQGARHLDADYPTLEIPSALRRAVATALQQGETHYTVTAGVEPVRAELAPSLAARGITATADEILITAGEQESRFLAIQALRRAGAVVALPAVVHPGARQAAAVLGSPAPSVAVDPERLTVTAAGVAAAIAAGATAIYLESPARLTGALVPEAELAAIGEICTKAGAWIVWDSGLAGWLPTGAEAPRPAAGGKLLAIGTPWPTLGLEAWSPGFLAGPQAIIDEARSIKQVISICTNTLTQWSGAGGAAVFAAESAARLAAQQRARGEAAAAALAAGLAPLPGEALATLALAAGEGQLAALAAAGVAFADGAPFGAPGVVRLAVAPDGSTTRALASLKKEA